jgi:hypothetical protein
VEGGRGKWRGRRGDHTVPSSYEFNRKTPVPLLRSDESVGAENEEKVDDGNR